MVEVFKQWIEKVDLGTLACAPGVAILAIWLLRTSLGRTSLNHTPIRRNHLPSVAVGTLLALMTWMMLPALILSVFKPLLGWTGWRVDLLANGIMIFADVVTVALVLGIASRAFGRGLKGFGLRWSRIPGDARAAFVNLLAVWPVLLAMVALVLRIGEYRYGPSYQIEQHRELELLTTSPHLSLQISIAILAVGMAPVVEEMLFRGLIQTAFRSLADQPWPAILMSSGMFAMVHSNAEHWPALFVLAVGMGYAYEKSGSLWRPIFMHALFNGVTILSNL